MNIRPDDILHVVRAGDTLNIVDLAKEMYGTPKAADPLMAYNDFTLSKAEPIPGTTTLVVPYTLSWAGSDPKSGMLRIDLFILQPRIMELKWKTREIVANDGSNDPSMFVEVVGKTISCPDETPATFEIYQYDAQGKHDLIDSNPTLKILNNELVGADGKPYKLWIEWHKTMYDWERPYYFGKLIVDKKEYVMPLKREAMLRLRQYHYLVNDPASDFPATVPDECSMVKTYVDKKGSFWDLFVAKDQSASHFVNIKDGENRILVKKNSYMNMMNKGVVYHHHIRTHGIAICRCNGNDNWVDESGGIVGNDGVIEWRCPVCSKSTGASGAMCFENNSLLVTAEVQALLHVPKLLIITSSCLTGITNNFPGAWIAKGTRWYIGWAVPVFFDSAFTFSKKFYSMWCTKYKMHPDKVKDVFDAIKSGFWNCRPRLFGA
jgi:hypothetical protein